MTSAGPFDDVDLADIASKGVAAASARLVAFLDAMRAVGGEAAKISEGCLTRSTEAFRAIAAKEIDPDVGREVIARELDATAELADGLANAGGRELAGFVTATRKALLEVGVPLLKIILASVI